MTDQENIIKNLSQNWPMPSKNSPIIIIGAGGHAKSCIDIIESSSKYKISHILGSKNEFNKKILS